MKILLLYNVYSDELGSSRPPLGMGYLSQSLQDAGIEHDVIDMKLRGYSERDLLAKIKKHDYDCVGMSVYTVGHKNFFGLLAAIKEQNPRVRTIVGGPHITILGRQILEEYSQLDFVFMGEAESSLTSFCKEEDYRTIPGLIYRNGREILSPLPLIREDVLDKISWPRYEKFELDKYSDEMGIISSRGCPYPCIFCSVGLTLGKKVRVRTAENIGEEMEYWYKKGRRIFNFLDDNFTFNKERVFAICDEIEKRKLKGLTLRASNGLRADRLDKEILTRMKQIGFKSFGIGVEAGNDKMLNILKKGETIGQIENAIKLCCNMGFEISLFFVYGTPGETIEDIEDSIRIAKKYPVFKADFYNLMPFPGTQLWQWVQENKAWTADPMELLNSMDKNLRFSKKTGKPFFETKELNADVREKLSARLRRVTLDVQRSGIERMFSKYGILKYVVAYLGSTMVFQRLFFNNNFIRKISNKLRFSS